MERIVGASREGKQSGSRQWKQEMEAECGVERIVAASRGENMQWKQTVEAEWQQWWEWSG